MSSQSSLQQVFDDLVQRLHAKRHRKEWRSRCPAHGGDNPTSLSMTLKDDLILLHCHAQGCSIESICEKVGVDPRALTGHLSEWRPFMHYDYHDEHGRVAYRVVRREPKAFHQQRPGSAPNEWIPHMNGVQRVLYRLPEVMAAVRDGRPVYIVEGEKDVETLRNHGFCATTSAGGSGAWRKEYAEILRNAHVIMIPDADEPGKKYAAAVRRDVEPVAASFVSIDLGHEDGSGKDITDWFGLGHSVAQLEAIVGRQSVRTPQPERPKKRSPILKPFSEIEPEELAWLWEPYIPLGKVTVAQGDGGVGKSWCLTQIAAAVSRGAGLPDASGRPCLPTPQGNALIITMEDDPGDTIHWRLSKANADMDCVYHEQGIEDDGRVDVFTLDNMDDFVAMLDMLHPKLAIIDPIQSYLGKRDMNKIGDIRPLLDRLNRLAKEYECAIVITRHLAKALYHKLVYRGMGSIDWSNAVRSVLAFEKHPNMPYHTVVLQTKLNLVHESLAASQMFHMTVEGEFLWCESPGFNVNDFDIGADLPGPDRTKRLSAKSWLLEQLSAGPREAAKLFEDGKHAGYSKDTLKRAKRETEIVSHKQGEVWFWASRRREGVQSRDAALDPESLHPLHPSGQHSREQEVQERLEMLREQEMQESSRIVEEIEEDLVSNRCPVCLADYLVRDGQGGFCFTCMDYTA